MKKKYFLIIILFLLSLFIFLVPNTASKYKSTKTKTLSISYSRLKYTIVLNKNDGTNTEIELPKTTYGVSQSLPANTFTRSGYDFIGWNTESDGTGVSYTDGQEIAYELFSNNATVRLYAQWYDKSYLNNSAQEMDYTCTKDVKEYTVTKDGRYVLEAWGAQGGSVSTNTGSGKTIPAAEGGKGGYSYEVVELNAGDKIYVAVGCKGVEVKNSADGTIGAGGYNGGGLALVDGVKNYSGSGGGATHFAITNYGELANYSEHQNDVLLVAGGGGGSYNSKGIFYYSYGGYGGGQVAGDSTIYYIASYRADQTALARYGMVYYQGFHIPGADQTLHTGTDFTYGTFGKGVDAITEISGTDAGAGGGWYGGNKLSKSNSAGGMAGSGGSGHINTTDSKYIDGKTIAGNMSIPTHDGSSYMTGNTGDGYAKISYVKPHYTVKFNANGGTGTMSDLDYAYDETKALTSNTFTRNACTFVKWNTETDGTGTDYSNGQPISGLSSTYDDEINLYAQWECDIYFQLPPDWSGSVYTHLFTSGASNGWPGGSATLIDSTKNIYNYKLSQSDILNYDNVIFSNGSSSTRQSVDIPLNSSNYGQIFVPELYSGSGIRVFFSGSSSWTPYLYSWNNSTGVNNHSWPGVLMSGKISGAGYSEIVQSTYDRMIFNNGSGGLGNQTDNINVPIYQDLTYKLARNGNNNSHTVSRFYYNGSWHDYDTWTSTGYTTWYSSDYANFVAAQTALGY